MDDKNQDLPFENQKFLVKHAISQKSFCCRSYECDNFIIIPNNGELTSSKRNAPLRNFKSTKICSANSTDFLSQPNVPYALRLCLSAMVPLPKVKYNNNFLVSAWLS